MVLKKSLELCQLSFSILFLSKRPIVPKLQNCSSPEHFLVTDRRTTVPTIVKTVYSLRRKSCARFGLNFSIFLLCQVKIPDEKILYISMYLHTILSGILNIIKTTPHIMRKVLYITFNLHTRQSRRSINLYSEMGFYLLAKP